MSNSVSVPSPLWKEVNSFFARLVAPCKDCLYGNNRSCVKSSCAAFQFRYLANRVSAVYFHRTNVAGYVVIENEILAAVRSMGGGPVSPSAIVLDSTNSKANKNSAITRLVKRGQLVETRTGKFTRLISLPKKEHENESNNNRNNRGGAARRASAR